MLLRAFASSCQFENLKQNTGITTKNKKCSKVVSVAQGQQKPKDYGIMKRKKLRVIGASVFFLFSLRHLFRFLLVYCQRCLSICFLFLFFCFFFFFSKMFWRSKASRKTNKCGYYAMLQDYHLQSKEQYSTALFFHSLQGVEQWKTIR